MKLRIDKILCFLFSILFLTLCTACDTDNADATNETTITASTLVSDAVLSESNYRLGDTMGDYTVTDVNGVSYKFSDVLKEKKAIVLNFWFINCGPCRIEFPYLEESYQNYKDDIEVFAINCVGEKEEDVAQFATENNLSFPVAVGDPAWNKAINIQGFPTTVVIDRFGVVTMKHSGYIDSTETFNNIFEFFTADEYTSTTVKNINDIK